MPTPAWREKREETFRPPWAEGLQGTQGTRRFDDFDRETRTGFEANTTPWASMTQAQFDRKMDQVAADSALLSGGQVNRVIWFGTEPLPADGRGGQLAAALNQAGIPYYQVPWTTE
jgi:hypothetical protein